MSLEAFQIWCALSDEEAMRDRLTQRGYVQNHVTSLNFVTRLTLGLSRKRYKIET